MRRSTVLLIAACGCGGDTNRSVADPTQKQPTPQVAANQPLAAATPIWTPVEMKPGWGTFVDPDRDCKQTWKDGALAIEVPGKSHELQWNGQRNAPRLLLERNGDFAMSVRVAGALSPKQPTGQFAPYQGAGIVVMENDGRFIRIERAKIVLPNSKTITYINFEDHEASGSKPVKQFKLLDDESVHLKIERRQNKITGFMSRNGTSWESLGEVSIPTTAAQKIGVAAVNSSNSAFTAEFNDFRFFESKG